MHRFARDCGYRKITLWTQSMLIAARHIYEEAGFKLAPASRTAFRPGCRRETWELEL